MSSPRKSQCSPPNGQPKQEKKLRRKSETNKGKANRLENKNKKKYEERAKPLVAAENGQVSLSYPATQSPKWKPRKTYMVGNPPDPSKFDSKGKRANGLIVIKILKKNT
jgi:hypothetical protein